jgi:hypothetical protein
MIKANLCSNWFVGTGPITSTGGRFCAGILTGKISSVYSTSTQVKAPMPEKASLTTLNADLLQQPTAWADII